MTVKLVVTDLDDTLLDTALQVPVSAKEAIRKMRQAGIIVAIATGRMHSSAELVAREAGISAPVVSFNGAMIRNPGASKPLYHCPMTAEQVDLIWQLGIDDDFAVQFYANDTLYLRSWHPLSQRYVADTHCHYEIVPDITRAVDRFGLPTKILLAGEDSRIQALWRRAAAYQQQLYVTSSYHCYLEFLNPASDKGTGVTKLRELLGIAKEDTLVIGDNYNDRELFDGGDIKIAMGNAVDPLKEMATWVTDQNDRDGWAKAMHRFVFQD